MKKYKSSLLLFLLALFIANAYAAFYDKFNVLIPIAFGLVLYLFYKIIIIVLPVSIDSKANYLLLITSIVFALSLGETLLRIHGKYTTHYEKKGGEWRSNFKSPKKYKSISIIWHPFV